jgi:DNA-directed RNA polymerase specialized sigma24 family protein
MSPQDVAVACPEDYEFVFRNYHRWLYGVVYRSGVPTYMVEDAAAEVLVRMLAQDGLSRFEGSIEDQPRRAKAYLASYFALGARAERSRIAVANLRHTHLQDDDQKARFEDSDNYVAGFWGPNHDQPLRVDDDVRDTDDVDDEPVVDLLDRLLTLTDDLDLRHIMVVADQNCSWEKSREQLLGEGWDPLKVRRGIKQVRALVSSYLCLS